MTDYRAIFQSIISDARYQANLAWGQPRPGHPEGTICAHIAELEQNLEAMRSKLSEEEYWKIKLLIHTHDTFKPQAEANVGIRDPRSHASLASAFLAEYCDDNDLLTMVQLHDEPFALFRQRTSKGECNSERFNKLLQSVNDWSLFTAFLIIDGCTEGKGREQLHWFFGEIAGKVDSRFTTGDMLT